MSGRNEIPPHSASKNSPKFTVAFAAGDLVSSDHSQCPSSSSDINITSGTHEFSVQSQSIATPPLDSKQSSSLKTDDSSTSSPLRFEGSIHLTENRGSLGASKRTLQTAFPANSTHLPAWDLERKRMTFGSSISSPVTAPSLSSTPRTSVNNLESNNLQNSTAKVYQSSISVDHSGMLDANPWSLPNLDTRSALAALSVAYSSLFRSPVPSTPTGISHTTSFSNPPRIPGPELLSAAARTGCGGSTGACGSVSSIANMNAPLLLALSEAHATSNFPTVSGDKSPLTAGRTHLAQPGSESLPGTMSSLLSENLDCWQQFQQAAYANNLDPHFLALYSTAGCPFELSGTSRRKNATRETTSMLKAWLNEHRKNPYPTKGEKIMLAIVTKMSLTQVSTWFANARRRLKKENKVTWNVRNANSSDTGQDSNVDEDELGPEFDDVLDMEKMGGLLNGHQPSISEISSPYPRHPLPIYHSGNFSNLEHRLQPKCATSTTGPNSDSESSKPTPRTHPFRPYISPEAQHRKIWSLVEMANNHTARGVGSQSPLSNVDVKSTPVEESERAPSKLERDKYHGYRSKDMLSKLQPSSPRSGIFNNETNRNNNSSLDVPMPSNILQHFPANLMADPRGLPLLSPAALAMFCMYYQQQQQQQQQQHQQQQQLNSNSDQAHAIPLKNPTPIEQLKTNSLIRPIYDKDMSQVHPTTSTPLPLNPRRLSLNRWPSVNGYVVGQMAGSQSEH